MQELIKIVGLLPFVNGKSELRVLDVKGKDFTIMADVTAEGNPMGIREFTIESPTLKELRVGKGETAYLVKTDSSEEGVGPYAVEYTAPAKKVASESVGTGRGATPNFSIQR
ncbi:hypothetical protein BXK49_16165 [Salmonella enterica subsp. enterica serovar Enteritidis]|nr:hypothetical protein [Salmonella enterica subsp. enterica serovar Enteritidis]ECF3006261.1 hypothetical protein [Salmonella enterica subsp. enterica serovar Enteritidis]ECQ9027228.1 hypothetical protein [Salmonella enterica subsp. enterica serovar Enteritidis]EDD7889934.1 hypothetical protein [Salmonella enterica subsp. enterica serovar Enteritidis]EIP7032417.1 hypothetical protein [Salmonella enterica]